MAISSGTKLGPYEILDPIGAGGMGEVYRARDTRLERTVAIKVLPAQFSSDPERKQRFEREAKAISSLQHPHICTLHDVGSQDGVDFLVMEHLQGETLAQRLMRGALPTEQVLKIGIEVADALDRAHRQGVVHRDLKPGNIMLTKSGTKLLDFGLAKPRGLPKGSGTLSVALTAPSPGSPTSPVTQQGVVVGTFQYMSPEQIEGKEADARSDIFALGAVLYEVATGKRAFEGKSPISVASAILEKDPEPITSVQPLAPMALEHVVKTCLAKDPDERWQSAADVRRELKWIAEGSSTAGAPAVAGTRHNARERLAWLVATTLLAISTVALSVAVFKARPAFSPQQVTRFAVSLAAGKTVAPGSSLAIALSPDGTRVAYVAESGGVAQLYLRAMDRLEPLPLAGTEGASTPFFSPDGQWIGFFADGKLKKISVQGGPSVALCEASGENRGASWGPDDTIFFTPTFTVGLSRVSAAGGPAQVLTTPDAAQSERTHRWPEVLPGGKAIVFTLGTLSSPDYFLDAKLAVLSLDTGKIKLLPVTGTNPHYASSGHLVFASQGGLFAVPFDLERLEVTSVAAPVLEGVMMNAGSGAAHYSLSPTGSLVYLPGEPQGASNSLVWVTRQGTAQPLPASARPYRDPRLSPDGKGLAVAIRGPRNSDVWVYEIARNTLTRLTFEGSNRAPLWTPDGKRIAYYSERGPSTAGIYWKAADGTGAEGRLTASTYLQLPDSWSPDGKILAFTEMDPKTQADIWILPMEGKREARPFLKTSFWDRNPAFSPDGNWLAYVSDESGQFEVYVQSFPGPAGKWQISSGGGNYAVWARNGRELFYVSGDRLMSVTITTQPSFAASSPRPLLEGRPATLGAFVRAPYDVAPDGQRFIMGRSAGSESGSTQMHVVLEWTEELKRQIPGGKD